MIAIIKIEKRENRTVPLIPSAKAGWTDALVKQFRKNVRRQNICVRHGFPFYSNDFEHKRVKDIIMKSTKKMKTKAEKVKYLKQNSISYWFPTEISYPDKA